MEIELLNNMKKLYRLSADKSIWMFALAFLASKSAVASIASIASRELSELATPLVSKLSAYLSNNFVKNYPNVGYWMLSALIAGVSLFFLLSSRNSKFSITYKVIGVLLLCIAVLVVLQPYIEFL